MNHMALGATMITMKQSRFCSSQSPHFITNMPPSHIVFHWDFCVSFRYRATTPNVEADWTYLFWEPMVRDAFLTHLCLWAPTQC
mmetsp:Transcript_120137/g.209140  ORF Transcript_120137/g.209140 Transcript_120137/m.209140 type:complete len:84 (+) Transcript_120137:900-1151(+)